MNSHAQDTTQCQLLLLPNVCLASLFVCSRRSKATRHYVNGLPPTSSEISENAWNSAAISCS